MLSLALVDLEKFGGVREELESVTAYGLFI
jgi:hypothetical protein